MRSTFKGWRKTFLGAFTVEEEQQQQQQTNVTRLSFQEDDPPAFKSLYDNDAQALEKELAKPSAPFISTACDDFTMLHVAVALQEPGLVERLLKSGQCLINDNRNSHGYTPLHSACMTLLEASKDPCQIVRMLLKEGAYVHLEATKGSLAIEYIVRSNAFASFQALPTPFMLETLRVLTIMLTGLQVAGVDFDRVHQRGSTLLAQCVSYGREYFVKLLAMNGANLVTTVNGRSLVDVGRESSSSSIAAVVDQLRRTVQGAEADNVGGHELIDWRQKEECQAVESSCGAAASSVPDSFVPSSSVSIDQSASSEVPLLATICFVVMDDVTLPRIGVPEWQEEAQEEVHLKEGEYFFAVAERDTEYVGSGSCGCICAVPKELLQQTEYGRNSLARAALLACDLKVTKTALKLQERIESEHLAHLSESVVLLQAWMRRWRAIKHYRANSLPRSRILELIDNERAYVQALSLMEKGLRAPLKEAELDHLTPLRFCTDLIGIHDQIHQGLVEAWSGNLPTEEGAATPRRMFRTICSVFDTYIPMLKLYAQIVPELNQFQLHFPQLREEHAEFDRIVQHFTDTTVPPRSETVATDASMWFMRIFQHILKYHLIFGDIIKDMRHQLKGFKYKIPLAQGEEIRDMHERFSALSDSMNKQMSASSANEAVLECQKAIVVKNPKFDLVLVAAHRKFVHSCLFVRMDTKARVRVLVFNDLFMLLGAPSKNTSIYGGEYISHFHLKYGRVFSLPDIPSKELVNGVQLSVYKPEEPQNPDRASKSITLVAATAALRDEFVKVFRNGVKRVLSLSRASVIEPTRPTIFRRAEGSRFDEVKLRAQSGSAFETSAAAAQYEPAQTSRLPQPLMPQTVVWLDRWDKPNSNEVELFRLEKRNPDVQVIRLFAISELHRFLEENEERLMQLPAPHFRIITNSRRDRDGGEAAPERLMKSVHGLARWERVPILVYCGHRARLAHLHSPVDRVFVTDSMEHAINFLAMDDLETAIPEPSEPRRSVGATLGATLRGNRPRSRSATDVRVAAAAAVAAVGASGTAAAASTGAPQESGGFLRARRGERRRSRVFIGETSQRISAFFSHEQSSPANLEISGPTLVSTSASGSVGEHGGAVPSRPMSPPVVVLGSSSEVARETVTMIVTSDESSVERAAEAVEAKAESELEVRRQSLTGVELVTAHPLLSSQESLEAFAHVAHEEAAPPPPDEGSQ